MERAIVDNLSTLVSLETVDKNLTEIKAGFNFIDQRLHEIFPFVKHEYEHDGVLSMVWLTQDTLKPDIILSAHLDVVPASPGMFKMRQENGKLLGRGTSDMKFAIAAFIEAAKAIDQQIGLQDVSLGIMITSDEEKGGFKGTNHLVNDIGYRSKLVIIPDGGDDWRVVTMAKGASWVKLSTTGASAHASRPWEGENAIDALVEVLTWFRSKYQNPKTEQFVTTASFGVISGGATPNQVADNASITIDFRYTPELTLTDIISELQTKFPNLDVQIMVDKPYFQVDPNNTYIKKWLQLLEKQKPCLVSPENVLTSEMGSADHHYFSAHGIPVLLTKPTGGLIHTEDEWLDSASFELFSDLLSTYLVEIFKTKD